jgi:hypothetical protein
MFYHGATFLARSNRGDPERIWLEFTLPSKLVRRNNSLVISGQFEAKATTEGLFLRGGASPVGVITLGQGPNLGAEETPYHFCDVARLPHDARRPIYVTRLHPC